jgi:hypothetical protein
VLEPTTARNNAAGARGRAGGRGERGGIENPLVRRGGREKKKRGGESGALFSYHACVVLDGRCSMDVLLGDFSSAGCGLDRRLGPMQRSGRGLVGLAA